MILRYVITQSSGKQRVIDNGDTGGQSERSSDSNKLTLFSPIPAQQLAMSAWIEEEILWFNDHGAWETGQEDLPSAYRYCFMSFQESLGCVVVWYHEEWQAPAYQLYSGLLFCLPLAVTSFNRFSRLVEALGRILCRTFLSLYFDDATITDLKAAKGSGQWAVNQLCLDRFTFCRRQEADHANHRHFIGLRLHP